MLTAPENAVFALVICLLPFAKAAAQRQYAHRSVLAEGQWHKVSIPKAGVYRISLSSLKNWGVAAEGKPSASIRLFGTGGNMLPEDNAAPRPDDLPEIAIAVVDGGDGILNGDDHILFYAPGPVRWQFIAGSWEHRPNIYADSVCYFLTLGGNGLRIPVNGTQPTAGMFTREYDYHAVYESDQHNILSGGKQWLGDRFSSLPEDALTRTYRIDLPTGLINAEISARFAARSTSAAKFDLSAGGQMLGTLFPPPVSGNIFETYASTTSGRFAVNAPSSLTVNFAGNASAQGWIDYFTLEGRALLTLPSTGTLLFRDTLSFGPGKTAGFEIMAADERTWVWDVSDPQRPVRIMTTPLAGSLRFSGDAEQLREFAAFRPEALPEPDYIGPLENQDLHGQAPVQMLIITPPAFLPQAEQLAAWRREHSGLTVACVPTHLIWNEFGSGLADPSALRDFLKMHYDRKALRYVLLMGAAGYNYKIKGDRVPVWQSPASFHGLNTHPSDDFYGFLDDNDDIPSRFPAGCRSRAVTGFLWRRSIGSGQ